MINNTIYVLYLHILYNYHITLKVKRTLIKNHR